MNSNIPIGADTSSAPWRQEVNKPRKIKVTVSETVSTTLEIEVDDYTVETGWDEDFGYFPIYNYEDCDLKAAVLGQYFVPQVAAEMLNKGTTWISDDFEVIL